MGAPKPLIELGGRTMLERCVEAVRPLASPILLVGDAEGLPVPTDCRAIPDRYPGAGPIGGIATALAALGPGAHIVVACDMPFLRTDILVLLLASIGENEDAAAPWLDTGPEPLCAVYRNSCLPVLERLLRDGIRSARSALQAVRARHVPEAELRAVDSDLRSFMNVNTPAELERCRLLL